MRKVLVSLIIALSLAFSMVPFASAHARDIAATNHSAQHHKVNTGPYATGGGCSSWSTNAGNSIGGKACISDNEITAQVLPDGYVSFNTKGQHNGISSCVVRIELYKGTTYVTRDQYNCSTQASLGSQDVHFGPTPHDATPNVAWSCILKVNIEYNDNTFTFFTSYASPGVTP